MLAETRALADQLESARAAYEKSPGTRPTHKLGFLGLWGERVDSLEHHEKTVAEINERIVKLKVRRKGPPARGHATRE